MNRPDIQLVRGGAGGTELASGRWHAFGGRGRRWERSIDKAESAAEQRIVRAIEGAGDAGLAGIDPEWVAFLAQNVLVGALAFNRCGQVLQAAGDRCRPSRVAGGLALQASMQHRQAQAIVLYIADLEHVVGDVPIEAARERWGSVPAWAAVREQLLAARDAADWGESVIAVNLCFEPVVGCYLRRELAARMALAHADPVTPVVAEAGEVERRLTQEWTLDLVSFLVDDPEHGERNHALLRTWIARHLPGARAAASGLAALCADLPRHPGGDGLDAIAADHRTLLAAAGLG